MTTYNERNRIKAAERKRDKELKAAEKQRLKDEGQRLNLEKKRDAHKHLGWRDVFGPEVRMDSMGLYLWNREMSQMAGMASDDNTGDIFLAMLVMAVNGYSLPPQDWDKKTTEGTQLIDQYRGTLAMPLKADGEAITDQNEKDLFVARGWGYMTSPGCLGLDNETAARIQDDMIKEFVDKFNKRWR